MPDLFLEVRLTNFCIIIALSTAYCQSIGLLSKKDNVRSPVRPSLTAFCSLDCKGFVHKFEIKRSFSIFQILTEHLGTKMAANARDLAKSKVGLGSRVSAVVSSLAIVVLAYKHFVELKETELKSLLSCLALEADPTEEKCTVYEEISREFNSESIRA